MFWRRKRALRRAANSAWDSQKALLYFGPDDPFTLNDAYANVAIFGATGAGKSSGSGYLLATSMLSAGFGMLVLCAKVDEVKTWQRYCEQTGRLDDLVLFRADGPYQFDPLNYEWTREGEGAGQTENIVTLLSALHEASDRGSSGSGGGRKDDQFWRNSLRQLKRNAVDVVGLAKGGISVPNLYRLVTTAPLSTDELRAAEWRDRSFCYQCLVEADRNAKSARDRRRVELAADYWMREFPTLSDKTRSIIVSSFVSMVDVLNRGILHERFSNGTNVTPADVERGKIIVVAIPVMEYGDVGLFANILWKHSFQKSSLRRDLTLSPRPMAYWADEAQVFLTESDQQYLAICRGSRVSSVLLTQNLSNYHAALGSGEQGRAVADGLLANLNLKIFHANGDHVTNEWASATVGRCRQFMTNASNQGGDEDFASVLFGMGSSRRSAGVTEVMDFEIQPSAFTTLRTGSKANACLVDAILFKNGARFNATGRTWMRATFRQE